MRIAINGYGRIGRSFVRALAEREGAGWQAPFSLVAINDKGRPEDLLYLTRYDTTHGRLAEPAELIEGMLRIGPIISCNSNDHVCFCSISFL